MKKVIKLFIPLIPLIPFGAFADELACTDEEFSVHMKAYDKGIAKQQTMIKSSSDYDARLKARNAKRVKKDPKNFCDYISDAEFDLPNLMPDWASIKKAWDSLEAPMLANAKGFDISTALGKAINKGIEQAREEIKKGTCKLALTVSTNSKSMVKEIIEEKKNEVEAIDEFGYYEKIEAEEYESLALGLADKNELIQQASERDSRLKKFVKGKMPIEQLRASTLKNEEDRKNK